MHETLKRGAIITTLVLLAAGALAGWTKTTPPPRDPSGYVTASQTVDPERPANEPRRYTEPTAPEPTPADPPPAPPPPARRHRSTKTSVEIVAGSAAGGAAIGAIAGHGKGAAIGALSGGAAGFIFDRLTKR